MRRPEMSDGLRRLPRRTSAARGASSACKGSGARSGRLFAVLALTIGALTISAAPALATSPSVTTPEVISGSAYTSVQLKGKVDPGDQYTYWAAQYSTDGITWSCFFCGFGGEIDGANDPGQRDVQITLNGLQPNTKYFLRLAAVDFVESSPDSSEVISPGPDPEITTLPVEAPTVLAVDNVSNVAYTTADASGEAERPANEDPAFNAFCRFEYVTDAQFSSSGYEGASQAGCETADPETENPETTPGSLAVHAKLTGLSPDTTYHLRLISSNAGGSDSKEASSFTTLAVQAPEVVSIDSASSITLNRAQAAGKVKRPANEDPAFDAECRFEYVTQASFEASGFAGAPQVACEPHATITDPGAEEEVRAELTGLTRATTYHLRLGASNLGGTDFKEAATFTTLTLPQAQTLSPNGVKSESAMLAGRVNPSNGPVSYQFEWGPAKGSYLDKAPAALEPLGVGDESFHVVTAPISGLSPSTPYHYRLVAENTTTHEVAAGEDVEFTTRPSSGPAESCPNESSRVGPSANLSDCRAYEFVTPGLNNAAVTSRQGLAQPSGDAIMFNTVDQPDDAEGAFGPFGVYSVAKRGVDGWRVESLQPPNVTRAITFGSTTLQGVSNDFSQSVVQTPQPLAGSSSPSGSNYYLRRADGSYIALSKVGILPLPPPLVFNSGLTYRTNASEDFKHIFLAPEVSQITEDPTSGGNLYEWFNGDLRLVGILPGPDQEPAPNGAKEAILGSATLSADGNRILFVEKTGSSPLYLRIDGRETVEVSASQRTVDPDPVENAGLTPVGITSNGAEVLFISKSELTDDAYTGRTNGDQNHEGGDLYSYDVQGQQLTDLTVDHDPADAATGANVTRVLGVSNGAGYIYFVATGRLAPGGVSGEPNIYVEHEGEIDFVAPAGGLGTDFASASAVFLLSDDGRNAAFQSRASLTGYDNRNPQTGRPLPEIFKYTYRQGLECASCRVDGEPPTGPANLVYPYTFATLMTQRVFSHDGKRLFFTSSDAVIPAASNGLDNAYEYVDGNVRLLSPGDSDAPVTYLDSSASGDDVFLLSYSELVPKDQGGPGKVAAIYDARVDADTFKATPPECEGEGCRGAGSSAPGSSSSGSASFEAPGELIVPKSKTARAKKLKLRITIPEGGQITVSGRGVKTARKSVAQAGRVILPLTLKPGANKTRLRKGVFKTRVQALFKPKPGSASQLGRRKSVVSLIFKGPVKREGGK